MAMIPPIKDNGLDEFLGQVLPADGNCWMLMRRSGGGMAHESFDDVDSIAARIRELTSQGVEVWHAVASYHHRHDETREGTTNGWGRKKENVAYLSTIFLDIDVAIDKPGKAYQSLEDAQEGLSSFVERLGQPFHFIVRSGSGLHAYWLLDEDLPREVWERIALKFKDATKVAGLLADPTRTADATSVLRPVGTINRKPLYGSSGRTVEGQWCRYGRVNVSTFEAACDRLIAGRSTLKSNQVAAIGKVGMNTLVPTQPVYWFDTLSAEAKLDTLKSMLAVLPAGTADDYSQWLSVGAALAGVDGVSRDTLFYLWADWSKSTAIGAASWCEESEAEQRERWNGLTRSGVGALIVRARGVGWTPSLLRNSHDDEATFREVVLATSLSGDRWSIDEAEAYMREHVMFVAADNQYLCDGLPLTKEALDTALARNMPISDRQITASGLLKKGAGTVVDYVGYKPGAGRVHVGSDGRKTANTWRSHPVEPVSPSDEDRMTFAEFLKHLGNGNDETRVGIKSV